MDPGTMILLFCMEGKKVQRLISECVSLVWLTGGTDAISANDNFMEKGQLKTDDHPLL